VKSGTMGAGKTLDLLRVVYQYKQRDKEVMVLKPSISNRGEGNSVIKSRLDGTETNAHGISRIDNILILLDQRIKRSLEPDVIVVDESQFLTEEQAEQLFKIAHIRNIPVLTYGLKTTFQGKFFEGSKRLFELGDDFEEIIGLCMCGKRAKFNARVVNGKVVKEGSEIVVGDEMYQPLCPKHFIQGKLE
jgi:thymidine kinase